MMGLMCYVVKKKVLIPSFDTQSILVTHKTRDKLLEYFQNEEKLRKEKREVMFNTEGGDHVE